MGRDPIRFIPSTSHLVAIGEVSPGTVLRPHLVAEAHLERYTQTAERLMSAELTSIHAEGSVVAPFAIAPR